MNMIRYKAHRHRFTAPGVFLLALGLLVLFLRSLFMPVHMSNGEEIWLEVPPSASTAQIAVLLKESGVIKNASAFRLYTRMQGVDGKLKPGRYSLHTTMPVSAIIGALVEGPQNWVKVTIPEGYTLQQIGELLENKGVVPQKDFYKSLTKPRDFDFLKGVPLAQVGLEGYLYPDTYHLEENSPADEVVDMMLQQFSSVIQEHDYAKKVAKQGLTLHQAVTVASMVEREARVASERPRIAGVIFNRLRLGMPLQIDATVQYALDKPKEKLYYRDLAVDSPYNTYKIKGLPPGPIASPGWSSLLAVIQPEQTDFLYYVAKPDGSHAFASTYQQHNQNIKKYQ